MDNNQVPTDPSIMSFWNWFSLHSSDFGERLDNSALIAELDRRVAALSSCGWEIGPATSDNLSNALVLTPCGNASLLRETQRIVAMAPACPGWEFHAAKPRKEWNRTFVIADDAGRELEVNANGWEYVLFQFKDLTFDIVVCASNIVDLSDNLKQICVEILLDGELGEANRIEHINAIEVVSSFEQSLESKKTSIRVLFEHFSYLLSGRKGGRPTL